MNNLPHLEAKERRAQKAQARACACCGRKLTAGREYTVMPGIGAVGPECERKLAGRLTHLQAAGLGELITTGFVVLAFDRTGPNSFSLPAAYFELRKRADRVGLKLDMARRPANGGLEMVLTVNSRSLKRYMKTQSAQAVMA